MSELARAVELLRAGELVAYPNETVYGLGADASNAAAVACIFAAKGRPADHPVIVHVPGAGHLERWATAIPDLAWELAEAFWPGPLTLILRRRAGVSDLVSGGQETIGLRVPGHPLALALLREFGGGIAAPSANRFGRISPTRAEDVREELGERVALILDGGACRVGIESTIIDLSRDVPQILRPGHIDARAIELVAGIVPGAADAAAPRVSGALAAHYAPRTTLHLVAAADLDTVVIRHAAAGRHVAVLARTAPAADGVAVWICAPADATGYARELYANLRRLDALAADLIVVEAVPATDDWAAVADRLRRAACGAGGD